MPQGLGGPTCATILTRWFAAKERGTYWGLWNISHNLGGFAAPVIVGGRGRLMSAGLQHPGALECCWRSATPYLSGLQAIAAQLC